ncbi:hypothetical protein VTL71DRAFT_7379, partial [Oculimacula yallundae]
DKIFLKPKVP